MKPPSAWVCLNARLSVSVGWMRWITSALESRQQPQRRGRRRVTKGDRSAKRCARGDAEVFLNVLVTRRHLTDHAHRIGICFVVLHPAAIHEFNLTARHQRLERGARLSRQRLVPAIEKRTEQESTQCSNLSDAFRCLAALHRAAAAAVCRLTFRSIRISYAHVRLLVVLSAPHRVRIALRWRSILSNVLSQPGDRSENARGCEPSTHSTEKSRASTV